MRYYLDTEFDGLGGELVSLALVPEIGYPELYLANTASVRTEWVQNNVVPVIVCAGAIPNRFGPVSSWWPAIERYFNLSLWDMHGGLASSGIEVIADWPDDIAYFSKLLVTGPGKMINIPGIVLRVDRVDAYPTDLPGAVQHNALWDARALRHKLR